MTRAATYFGKPCPHCGGRERYRSSYHCVQCSRARAKAASTQALMTRSARIAELVAEVAALKRDNSDLLALLSGKERENEELRALMDLPDEEAPSFGLTNSEHVIFRALMARKMVSEESLYALLYADRIDDAPDSNVVPAFVSLMRAKLKPHGVQIETVYGIGWSIPAVDKARVRELLSRKDAETHCGTVISTPSGDRVAA